MPVPKCDECGAELVEIEGGGCIPCLLLAAQTPSPEFLIQEKLRYFGDFELKEVLGRGGMGVVFRAWQISMQREVALKMINAGELASAEAVRRFRREAEAASLLDHPNIVKIYAVGEHEGHQFIAMELSAGKDLAAKIQELKGNYRTICEIVMQTARAVHFAHRHGVLHRDLKPANILIDDYGVPLLMDFGLAKITMPAQMCSSPLTQRGRLVGTPAYMAPELFCETKQHLTITSETFSLGVILYEALSGKLPYAATNSVDLLNEIRGNAVVPLRAAAPEVPRPLQNVCAKALRNEERFRYQSAEELANDLERWLNGEPVEAKAGSTPELVWRWALRRRLAIAVFCVLFGAFAISMGLLIRLKERSARVEHVISAARYQLQTDLEKLWSDGNLTYQKITSENLSILAGLEDSGAQNAIHYSFGAYENNGRLTNSVEAYAPILNQLERAMQKAGERPPRFDLVLYKFNPDARRGFSEGKFEIGRFGANPYDLLRQTNSEVILLAKEKMDHDGVIFVRNNSPIRTIEQLRGAKVAFGEKTSTTSGTFAPAFLYDAGLRASDLKEMKWHPVNGGALRAVSVGEFDAGVTGRDTFLRSGLTNLVILSTFDSETAVWVVNKRLGEVFTQRLREALLACPSERATHLVQGEGQPFVTAAQFSEDLVRIKSKRDAFFAGTRQAGENK
jgi:serine/threonine protein kinase